MGIKCVANYANEANEGHIKSGYDVNEINFGCGEVKKDNEWVCD
jgi:hypothetical protein